MVSAIGVENEAGLPFAALHQLLRPLESEVAKLPVSHQHTLRAAFRQEDGSPDLYAVALAALQLIGEAAAVRPTVVILDDLQWLDSGSADALSLVARRIGSDAVLVLGATRTGSEDSARRAGLPDIMVEPLDEQAAAVLLKARSDVYMVRAVDLVAGPMAWWVLLPLSVASLLTGIVQSLGTPWGLARHYWVFFKLLLNVIATAILLLYTRTVDHYTGISARPESTIDQLRAPTFVIHAAAATLILLCAMVLAIYKPRGLTPFGIRARRS